MSSRLNEELLGILVVMLLFRILLRKFIHELLLVLEHSHGQLLSRQVVELIVNRYFVEDSQVLGHLILINIGILRENLIFSSVHKSHHFVNVQACQEVARDYVRCSDNHIVHMLAGEGHEHSLLKRDERIKGALVISGKVIVPEANVEERSRLFGLLKTFEVTIVKKVKRTLHVDDCVTFFWRNTIRKIQNAS